MNDISAEPMGHAIADNREGNERHERSESHRGLSSGDDAHERKTVITSTEIPDDTERREDSTISASESRDRHLGLRLLRVAVVAICYFVIEMVAKIVTVAQFVFLAWRKQPHPGMQRFGARLSEYMYAMWRYCTFASDDAPWPFKPWPSGQVDLQR